jgi:hypothetical protein
MRRSKYGARRTEYDGRTFDSAAEARHYAELKLREKAGEIEGLVCQPKIPISLDGQHVCTYIADFLYVDAKTRELVIEDVKGVRTAVYQIKRKLVECVHGLKIVEPNKR